MVGFEDVVAAIKELTEEVRNRLTKIPTRWDATLVKGFQETAKFSKIYTFTEEVSWFRIYNDGTVTVYLNFDREGETTKYEFLKTKTTKDFTGNPKEIFAKVASATACDIYIAWWY